MKDRLKRFIISNRILTRIMYTYYRVLNGKSSVIESEKRLHYNIFDFEELSKPIAYSPSEVVIDNNLYGQAFVLKRFAKIKSHLTAYIEHGLFWGGMVHQDEYYWYVKQIITFSANRKKAIANKGINKEVICIGPYIHYAKNIYDPEEMQNLKKSLGRVLLVFPSKSILHVQSEYDIDEFGNEVNKIAKNFDTVLVSLFFIDALNKEITNAYISKGFKVVTSGHRYDNYFLDRQRTIIELADMTMSNEVGTHIGYCIHLNKPHYIFKQNLKRVGASQKELKREMKLYDSEEDRLRNKEKDKVSNAFSEYLEDITQDQKRIVEKYWGTSEVKTQQELKSLLT